jgi:hypothetical protein
MSPEADAGDRLLADQRIVHRCEILFSMVVIGPSHNDPRNGFLLKPRIHDLARSTIQSRRKRVAEV